MSQMTAMATSVAGRIISRLRRGVSRKKRGTNSSGGHVDHGCPRDAESLLYVLERRLRIITETDCITRVSHRRQNFYEG